jgi:hypothetical protein
MRDDLSNFAATDVTPALDPPPSGIWTARIITGAGTQIVLDAPLVIAQCNNDC